MTRKVVSVLGVLAVCIGLLRAEETAVKTTSGITMRGTLRSVSDEGIVLLWSGREKKLCWDDLHPESVYQIRKSRLDPKSADAHIKLGDYCAEHKLPEQAKKEYQAARKLDPALRGTVEKAIAEIPQPAKEKAAPAKTEKANAQPEAKAVPEAPPKDKPAPVAKEMTEGELKSAGQELIVKMHEDPVKYHKEWVHLQKLLLNQIEETINCRFFTYETDHYIYHSTMSPAVTKKISNGCEDLYKQMCKAFKVGKGDLLWAGKCLVHLFEKQSQFIEFAVKIDRFDRRSAQNVGGYFSHQGRFVHIAIPKTGRGGKGFESTLIHEGAHAFLQLLNEDVFIKPWIHEGVAQYFEHRCFPHEAEWTYRRSIVQSQHMSLSDLRAPESFIGMDAMKMNTYYSFSWSALHYMISANPEKFRKFIRALKKGKTEDEAIKEAFGKSMREFERAWLSYAKKSF